MLYESLISPAKLTTTLVSSASNVWIKLKGVSAVYECIAISPAKPITTLVDSASNVS